MYLTKSFHLQPKIANVIQDQVMRNEAANIQLQDPIKDSINELRLELFLKKYQPTKKEEVVIRCFKKMEGSFLPPCASVLQQKTNRTNHIAGKWLSSWTSYLLISNPLNCGWELGNRHWKVKWFEGDIAPKSVELITANESNVVEDDDNGKVCFHFFVG